MVKANAYGHGLKEIVSLLKDKVNWFGVSSIVEAIEVKKYAKKDTNILVVGKSNSFDLLVLNRIHITVDTMQELKCIEKICIETQLNAFVHIAINTGMNRIGVSSLEEFEEMTNFIKNSKYIVLVGIFTHMYNADQSGDDFNCQMTTFKRYFSHISKDVFVHVGGSFCLNYRLPKRVNMVRVGLFLYGYGNVNLKPVMQIRSRIVKILNVKKNENIGYGHNVCKKDRIVALIPQGYADGLPRKLFNRGFVKVNGKKCKIIAMVCMDCIIVDITKVITNVGDKVLVMFDADMISKWTKISVYEVLTRFSMARVKTVIET